MYCALELILVLNIFLPQVVRLSFWFKYNLGQKYYAPQVRPSRGSNSWPPDHDSTSHVTKTPALTTRPSVTFSCHWRTSKIYSSAVRLFHWSSVTDQIANLRDRLFVRTGHMTRVQFKAFKYGITWYYAVRMGLCHLPQVVLHIFIHVQKAGIFFPLQL